MQVRLFILSLSLAFTAGAFAQSAAAPAAAASATSAVPDCVPQKPRHDHGADRGMPTPQKKCGTQPRGKAASTKAIEGHDHGKVHKNQ